MQHVLEAAQILKKSAFAGKPLLLADEGIYSAAATAVATSFAGIRSQILGPFSVNLRPAVHRKSKASAPGWDYSVSQVHRLRSYG